MPTEVQVSIAASCSTDSQGQRVCYLASNLTDGQANTAWRADPKFSPWLEIALPAPAALVELRIKGGYDKRDPNGIDRWTQNHRPRQVRLYLDGAASDVVTLEDTRDWQSIRLSEQGVTRVRVQILDTYRPSHKEPRDFVAISEIEIIGIAQ